MAQSAWPWPTFPDPLKSEPTIPSYFSLPYKQNVESGFLLLKRKQFLQIWAEEHDSYLLSLSFFFPPFKNICQTPWLDLIPWTNISLPLLLLGPTPPVSLLAETPCSALQSGSPGSSVHLLSFFFFSCVCGPVRVRNKAIILLPDHFSRLMSHFSRLNHLSQRQYVLIIIRGRFPSMSSCGVHVCKSAVILDNAHRERSMVK